MMKRWLLQLGNFVIGLLVAIGVYAVVDKTLHYAVPVTQEEDEWIEALPDKYVSCEECLGQPAFMKARKPDSALLAEALAYYNVQYPEIVQAQAKFETSNFKSPICRNYNNLFGLWNANKHDFYKFTYWWESVLAYKLFIQSRYVPPNDYYSFLREIGYVKDTAYISKLKRIVKENKLN